MATISHPARSFPGAGVHPLDSGHFDEASAKAGTARPPYATVIDALARQDLVELRGRVRSNPLETSTLPGQVEVQRAGSPAGRRPR